MSQTEKYIGKYMERYLQETELPDDRTHVSQLTVFHHALAIFSERSDVRGDLWAEYDIHDAWQHSKDKLFRITAVLERMEHAQAENNRVLALRMRETINDDILDLINYAAFMYRHLNGMKP